MQWSVRDVAERLNVSERTVLRWVKHDDLPASRIGSQFRFNRAELLEWATAHKLKVPPAIFYGENEERERMPSFSDALAIGGIFHKVGGTDKPSVLRAIVNLLRLPDGVDRELLYGMLLAREALASTAVGDGIAIPHPRNPIVLRVIQPLVTLCLLGLCAFYAGQFGAAHPFAFACASFLCLAPERFQDADLRAGPGGGYFGGSAAGGSVHPVGGYDGEKGRALIP